MSEAPKRNWSRRPEDREDLISNGEDPIQEGGTDEGLADSVEIEDRKPVVYTSQWATLFILVNVTVGVGLLAMPFAFQSSGIAVSMLMQAFFLVLIVITCIICTELTVKSDVKSYHAIIQKHCHRYVYQIAQVSILLLVFGTSVAYMVTIGDQTDSLFVSLYGSTFCHTWYMNRKFVMTFVTIFAMKPLCSARTVDFLKYASFLGIVSIGFIYYVVLAGFMRASSIAKDVNYLPKSVSDIYAILPVFCLGYQCHLSLVPTVGTINKRDKPKAFVTTTIAMIIAAIIYSLVSIFAALTFGAAVKKDLTENYPGKDWATLSTIAIVAIKCVLTLPAAYLPARLSLVDILTNSWPRFAQFSEPVRRVGVTVVFLSAALLLALLVPDILVAVNILGCLAVMFIFQLPGLAYLSLIKQNRLEKQQASGLYHEVPIYSARDKMKLMTSYFLIGFGFIMMFVVLYKSIDEVASNSPSPQLCNN